jgi:hypothetical protein
VINIATIILFLFDNHIISRFVSDNFNITVVNFKFFSTEHRFDNS